MFKHPLRLSVRNAGYAQFCRKAGVGGGGGGEGGGNGALLGSCASALNLEFRCVVRGGEGTSGNRRPSETICRG